MNELNTRIKALDGYLTRFRDGGISNLINGVDVGGTKTFQTHSPVDESLICDVALGGAAEIDQAALAAKAAFPEWAAMDGNCPQVSGTL